MTPHPGVIKINVMNFQPPCNEISSAVVVFTKLPLKTEELPGFITFQLWKGKNKLN